MTYINGDVQFEYEIIRKRIKHVYLRVKSNKVVISAPYSFPYEKILNLLSIYEKSIIKKLNNMSNTSSVNQIYLFGKAYSYQWISSKKNGYKIEEDTIYFYGEPTEKRFKKIQHNLYCEELAKYILSIKKEIENSFQNQYHPFIGIKDMRSCYGVNHIRKNEIYLSTFLGKFDYEHIKAVLYHEYCHCAYPNHSKQFHFLYDTVYPNNKEMRKKLISETKNVKLEYQTLEKK